MGGIPLRVIGQDRHSLGCDAIHGRRDDWRPENDLLAAMRALARSLSDQRILA